MATPREVRALRRVRHGNERLAAAYRLVRRRSLLDPFDAHRSVQPPAGPVDDEHRLGRSPGRPSLGSWLAYGLGSEIADLPAFVSLVTVGRGIPGGFGQLVERLLAEHVLAARSFARTSDPVLNLGNPRGIDTASQRASITAVNDLNRAASRRSARLGTCRPNQRLRTRVPHAVGRSGTNRLVERIASDAG